MWEYFSLLTSKTRTGTYKTKGLRKKKKKNLAEIVQPSANGEGKRGLFTLVHPLITLKILQPNEERKKNIKKREKSFKDILS